MHQVVYFHNPQYERRAQDKKRVESISKGDVSSVDMVQLLAPIMQLHPDILIEQEDSTIFSECSTKVPRDKWAWLIMGRTVYLCSPHEGEEGRTIYHHPNVAEMLHFYRQSVGLLGGD